MLRSSDGSLGTVSDVPVEARGLVKRYGAGVVVQPDDVDGIKAAIGMLFEAFRKGQRLVKGSDVSKYERSVLTEQLVQLMTDIS